MGHDKVILESIRVFKNFSNLFQTYLFLSQMLLIIGKPRHVREKTQTSKIDQLKWEKC